MLHVVLLGDSVFDNGAYVPGEPDVVRQLRARLPPHARATLVAVDGAVIADVDEQLRQIPRGASHLIVSVGGNDALSQIQVLEEPVRAMDAALCRLADIADRFGADYRAMLERVLGIGLPTAVCTIYDPRFPDARLQRLAVTALAILNDRIMREAFARALPLLDLRLVCARDEDFANPIEPSAKGGDRIAAAIAALTAAHAFSRRRSEVFAG